MTTLGQSMNHLNHTSDPVDADGWTYIDIDRESVMYDKYFDSYYQATRGPIYEQTDDDISDDEFMSLLCSLDDDSKQKENLAQKKQKDPNFRFIDEPWTPYDDT